MLGVLIVGFLFITEIYGGADNDCRGKCNPACEWNQACAFKMGVKRGSCECVTVLELAPNDKSPQSPARQGLPNQDIGDYTYHESEPETASYIIQVSSTWLTIGGGAIILLLLINILCLSYYNCCAQPKKAKWKRASVV